MNHIQIMANGVYLPKKEITNEELNTRWDLSSDFIEERTGIKKRYYADETLSQMAIKAVQDLKKKVTLNFQQIDMILVATTSTQKIMPGISYEVQEYFAIPHCFCMDILAGCNGYINAFDIARNYIALRKNKLWLNNWG